MSLAINTDEVVAVLLAGSDADGGWIEIEPGSFIVDAFEMYDPPPPYVAALDHFSRGPQAWEREGRHWVVMGGQVDGISAGGFQARIASSPNSRIAAPLNRLTAVKLIEEEES